MSVQLTVVKRASISTFEEVAAIGHIDLEPLFDWTDELCAVASMVERLDTEVGHMDFRSEMLLLPAGKNLRRFELSDRASQTWVEYQFTGSPDDLDQLGDRMTLALARHDMASA